jgi:protein-S-isoprenylcysteine O-methyltransferase Ste14
MEPWCAQAAVLAGTFALIAIRAPHGQRSRGVAVTKSRRGALENALLAVAMIAFVLPLVWICWPAPAPGDYPLVPAAYVAGVALLVFGLWIFYRSHADLGTNWSITLEVREQHTLVTRGIYRGIRHPMYLGLLVFSLGEALVLPNWIAGPAYLVAMLLLFAGRLGPEEQLMLDEFGSDYDAYRERSKRLIPGVW